MLHIRKSALSQSVASVNESDDVKLALSDNLQHLKKVTLSECKFDNTKIEPLCWEYCIRNSMIVYITKFEISQSNITYSFVRTIVKILELCIIENLIIAGNIWSEVSKAILQSAFDEDYTFRNFEKGLPLVLNGHADFNNNNCPLHLTDDNIMVFVVNSDVNHDIINMAMDIQASDYEFSFVNIFFISSNLMVKHLNRLSLKLNQFLPPYEHCVFIATGLMDEVTVSIAEFFNDSVNKYKILNETDQPPVDYCLVSDTKLLSNMPSTLSIERWFAPKTWMVKSRPVANPDTGNCIGKELFKIFCKSLSNSPSPITEVDVSSYQLSSNCIESFVESLQHCCIKKLLIYNYGNRLAEINQLIYEAHLNGKVLQNSLSGIPLVVIAHTTKCVPIEKWVNLYFVDYPAAENFETVLDDLQKDINFVKLHCVFLNFFTKNNGLLVLQSKRLSSLLINYCDNVFVYEVGMTDGMAVEIMEYLKSLHMNVECVLASKTMLLAYRADLINIFDALSSNPYIVTVNFECIKFYDAIAYLGAALFAHYKFLNSIVLKKCHLNDQHHWQLSRSLFNNTSTINYLKTFDISHNNIKFCSNIILESLQYCIIEKIILSERNISDDDISFFLFHNDFQEQDVMNFKAGIPLVISEYSNEESSPTIINYFTVFLINTEINKRTIHLITDVLGFNISNYRLFVKNVVLQCHDDQVMSTLSYSLQKVTTSFTFFGTDLMDEIGRKIASCLTETNLSVEFYLNCRSTSLVKFPIVQHIFWMFSSQNKFIMPLSHVCNFDLINISNCIINNEEFLSWLHLLNLYTKIKVLDVSHCNVSPMTLSKIIIKFHIQTIYLYGDVFDAQETLTSLFPDLMKVAENLEIKFSECSSYILCNILPDITSIFKEVFCSQNLLHLFVINCSMSNKQQVHVLDLIFPILTRLSLPASFSIHLYNNSLTPEDVITAVEILNKCNICIEESDFKFKSEQSNSVLINTDGMVYFTSELCSNVVLQWTSPDMTECTEFCFNNISMMSCVVTLTNELLKDQNLCRVRISNCCVTEEISNQIGAIVNNSNYLEYLELVNLDLSSHNFSVIFDSLKNVFLRHLVVISVDVSTSICTDSLADIIASNNSLEHIEVSNCNLNESAIVKLATAMESTSLLKYLCLSSNVLSDLAATELAVTLSTMKSLQHLDLSSTKLKEAGIIAIVRGLSNANLHDLFFNNCNITYSAAIEIASCIASNFKCFKNLGLSNCTLEEESLACITEALINTKSLNSLDLSYNLITGSTTINIATIVAKNTAIKNVTLSPFYSNDINFSICWLSSFQFIYWSSALYDVIPKYLNRSHLKNTIFIIQIASKYDSNWLTHFRISHCNCPEIFECLKSYSSLEYLDVSSSKIAYDVISKTIKNNVYLKNINIANCFWLKSSEHITGDFDIPRENMFYEISQSLLSLHQLEHINISGNKITIKTATVIAAVISNSKRLQHLDLCNCETPATGLITILKSLSGLQQLIYLNVGFNTFSINFAKEVAKVLLNNKYLVHLNLKSCILNRCVFVFKERQLQHLRYLNLHKNIFSNKSTATLETLISAKVNLQKLDVSYCIMTTEGMKNIIGSLKMIHSLKCINISHCKISSSVQELLLAAISSNEQLEHLNLANCQLHATNIARIIFALSRRSILKYLNLQSNLLHSSKPSSEGHLPSEPVMQLAAVINNNTFLEYINLSHCGLSGSDVTCITTALSGLSYLQYFNISHNKINDEAAVGVASVIISNPSLEHLCMTNCCMEEDGIRKVAEALLVCKHLRTLDLKDNHITYLSNKRIWEIICNNPLIEHFNMPHCDNAFNCEIDFNKIFNFRLSYLDLGSNNLNSSVATALASFIRTAGTIKSLNISYCDLPEDGLLAILSVLSNAENLHYLNMASNKLTEKGAILLCEMLKTNQMITTLILTDCGFTGNLLGDIIEQCKSLQYLDISHNEISDKVADSIASVFTSRPSLEYLNISGCNFYEDGYQVVLNAVTRGMSLSWSKADDNANTIVAAVVNNYNLLVFNLSNKSISENMELFKIAEVTHCINLRHDTISEKVQELVTSYFYLTKIEYLNFYNCDFNEYKICVILRAAKHVRTLQYLILNSSKVFDETLEDIAIIISNNPTIKYLDLSDCELSGTMMSYIAPHLANMSNLQHLDISHNEVTDKTAVQLAAAITNNTSLVYLNVSNCAVENIGLQIVGGALMDINSLISLDIVSNDATLETTKNVIAVVTLSNNLQTLCLNFCFTESELFAMLPHLPSHFKSLQHLDLQSNVITDWSANQLNFILTNSSIKHLNMSQCVISNDGINKVLSALRTVTTLESLILSSSKLGYDPSDSLETVMKMNKKLNHLDLSDCGLSYSQLMTCISLALTPPSTIEILNVSSNNSADTESPVDLKNLRPCLFTNTKLSHLNLSFCKLPDVIMSYVLLMLTNCTSLSCLNLHSCVIHVERFLPSVTANNPMLTRLDVCCCNLQQKDIKMILRSFRQKDSIQSLLLSSNVIQDATAIEVASTVITSQLKHLALSDCKLTEFGLHHIARALQSISTLQHLDLSYNTISDEAAVTIASALSSNTLLEHLDLSYCAWSTNGLAIIHKDLEKYVNLKEVDFSYSLTGQFTLLLASLGFSLP